MISWRRALLVTVVGFVEPPRYVMSVPLIAHLDALDDADPVTTPAPIGSSRAPRRQRAQLEERRFGSTSASIRSRTSILPRARWRST